MLITSKIRRYFGCYLITDWLVERDYKSKLLWKSLTNKKNEVIPNSNKEVKIRTKYLIPRGWYLFGIKHKGKNNRLFGTLKSSEYSFSQARPMYPVRRRWRVIHIRNYSAIKLTLENVDDKVNLNELYLIRIPRFEALRRIKKRYLQIHGKNNSRKVKEKKYFQIWKEYNHLLLKQKLILPLNNYSKWIQEVEPYINKIINESFVKEDNLLKFNIQLLEEFTHAPEGSFVIPKAKLDNLSNNAIQLFSSVIEKNPKGKIFYSDEDCIDKSGKRFNPKFKPAWNRELFWTDPSYGNCWVISAELWNKVINKLEKKKAEKTLENIVFKAIQEINIIDIDKSIKHIPVITYHKYVNNSIEKLKSNLDESALRLYEHLKENKKTLGNCSDVSVINKNLGLRIHWNIPRNTLISIFIPTRDHVNLLKSCLHSIYKTTLGLPIEIIIIDNNSIEKETEEFFKEFIISSTERCLKKVIKYPNPFNYSAMNNYASNVARGEVYVLVNNDIVIISENWVKEIASNALRPDVGCVGSKLLYDDKSIQHAGVILGIGGIAGHAHKYFPESNDGYHGRLKLSQEYSAVTGALLGVSKRNWELIGGMDEKNLKVNYNDVDFCLKAGKIGLKNIFLPQIVAYHFESKTRGRPEGYAYNQWKKEKHFMKKKWGYILQNDPAYNPHLTLLEENFSIRLNIPDSLYCR